MKMQLTRKNLLALASVVALAWTPVRAIGECYDISDQCVLSSLQELKPKYEQADPGRKHYLAIGVLGHVGGYDTKRLPPDLQAFVQQVRADWKASMVPVVDPVK